MNFQKLNLIKIFLGLILLFLILVLIRFLVLGFFWLVPQQKGIVPAEENEIILPSPEKVSETSIEEALLERRSIRDYKDEPLNIKEVSQILWAAQGITAPERGGRTAPSAGALYPLEVYLIVKKVDGLTPGAYGYLPEGHKLKKIFDGDVSKNLALAALGQMFIAEAPINLVFTGVFSRTTQKYGERGINYVYMEVGHAAQNVCLQVQSLNLGTVTIGAFNDEEIKKILNLSDEETTLYLMPVGRINH